MNTTNPDIDSSTSALKPLELAPLPEHPLVSVLMTNYNYARYIGESIESVLKQTYPYFELIICDDGSTDNSVEVIDRYLKGDQRIRLVRKENGGQASATAAAYAEANGEIISLLDADDLFHSTKLEKIVAAFKYNPAAGCCMNKMVPVSKTGETISKPIPDAFEDGWLAPEILRSGLFGRSLSTSGLSFRKQVMDYAFPLPSEFSVAYRKKGAPTDMYLLGIARLISCITSVPEILVDYRFHGTNDGSNLTPSLKSINLILDHMTTIYTMLYEFVQKFYDPTIANFARLEDYPSYWEHLLALYVFEHKPRSGVRGYSVEQILSHVPQSRRKDIWRVILALPSLLAEEALKAWWGFSPWKKVFRPVWRLLRVK